ncbi:LOW QUALITY PROTEIN: vomeronasal type-2 receptor 116-like [Latimeria chalumnae]|uniref:LOW QUALITY PROTEIN: vomeronasal type-2 receptor 116-like n=1 Tax=Latimeria chalumnae TaxID=7897 RepID=UPI00313D252F
MIFAIEEINQNSDLLPNITLGFQIYDSCALSARAFQGAFLLVTGQDKPVPNYQCQSHSPLAGVIGEAQSQLSIPIARLLGLYRYPQISYSSTVVLLNDKQEFPSFFRTLPSDDFQSMVLARLVIHFGWTWVGLISEDSDYGQQGIQIVKEEIVKAGSCIAFSEIFPTFYSKVAIDHIVEVIKRSAANAIVIFSNEATLVPLMEETARQNITGKVEVMVNGMFRDLEVLMGVKKAPELQRKAKWDYITIEVNALHHCHCRLEELWHKWQDLKLLHYVKNVRFKSADGMEVFFDKNGNPPPFYDILNWQITPNSTLKYVNVGSFDFTITSGQDLRINEDITWNGGYNQVPHSVCSESCVSGYRKAGRLGQPICCFDCIQCSIGEISNETDSTECFKCHEDHWPNDRQDKCIPKIIDFLSYQEPMGATLAAISISCALFTATILCIFINYRSTPIVKANNCELSYLLLLALVLGFLCSLVFIGHPRTWTCMLRQTAFGIIFALCVSCVLAKTIMVVIAFNATKPNSNLRKWVGSKLPNSTVFVYTIIQVIICIVWLCSSPPYSESNMKSKIGMIIIECDEGSTTAFWCMLGYMGLLAIVSFVVAFLARNLPGSLNEAKFITFSMLVFVSVWLAFIPAYLSTRGKYIVAVEIFAMLASSAGLLSCIFFPKCYIIILRPDRNTREYLMGRGSFSNKKIK